MTTHLFSRRSLQRVLDELSGNIDDKQRLDLVKRLNRKGRDRLAATWEAVFLHAFAKEVYVKHEQPISTGSKPDFAFELTHDDLTFNVVGDITSASDKGLDYKNPVAALGDELTRLAKRYRLDPNHFRYDVKGKIQGDFGDAHMVLKMPSRNNLADFSRAELDPFVRRMSKEKPVMDSFSSKEDGFDITITYDQKQWGQVEAMRPTTRCTRYRGIPLQPR